MRRLAAALEGGGEPTHLQRRRPAKVRAGASGRLLVQALLVAVQPIRPPGAVPFDAVVIAVIAVAIAVIVVGIVGIAEDDDRAAVVMATVMVLAAMTAPVATGMAA